MEKFFGFPKAGVQFLRDLENNNNKEWFQENKATFKESLEAPAKELVSAMTVKLKPLIGDPVGGKIFRIYRDVRFSKDKTPYNTVLKIALTNADKKEKTGCSSPMYFFGLTKSQLRLGTGVYEFHDSPSLDRYRKAVADSRKGPALGKVLQSFQKKKLWINEPHFKRVPTGYEKEHPREQLLRHKGLYAFYEAPIPNAIYSERSIDFVLKKYKELSPLYNWLSSLW